MQQHLAKDKGSPITSAGYKVYYQLSTERSSPSSSVRPFGFATEWLSAC